MLIIMLFLPATIYMLNFFLSGAMSLPFQENNIYQDVLYTVKRIFGLETFYIRLTSNTSGVKVNFRRSLKATAYTGILIVAILLMLVYQVAQTASVYFQVGTVLFSLTIATIILNFSSLVGLANMIWNINPRKEIIKLFLEVDYILFNDPSNHNEQSKCTQVLAVTVAGIYTITLFTFDLWLGGDHAGFNRMSCMFSYLTHSINLIATLNYTNWVLQVMTRLKAFNLKLHQVTCKTCGTRNLNNILMARSLLKENNSLRQMPGRIWTRPTRESVLLHSDVRFNEEMCIFSLRVLFEKVSKCIFLINDAYGAHILLVIALHCTFCQGYILLVTVSVGATKAEYPVKIVISLSVLWCFLQLSQTAWIISSCRAACAEVRRTLAIIQEMLLEPPPGEGMLQQLGLFHDQVSSRDFSFSAGGVLKIDCSLLGYMVMSIVSNVVVLIQMTPLKQQ
ncbi:uncharacterized protein LOC134534090 [Bacillus rossius redtenbacheri]|uniref:uncharacterized protein LOC134534090 n=1 Tax=Bacillus rossius redtenbacheri TaxID=93214 RepID=UPI002FDCC4F6